MDNSKLAKKHFIEAARNVLLVAGNKENCSCVHSFLETRYCDACTKTYKEFEEQLISMAEHYNGTVDEDDVAKLMYIYAARYFIPSTKGVHIWVRKEDQSIAPSFLRADRVIPVVLAAYNNYIQYSTDAKLRVLTWRLIKHYEHDWSNATALNILLEKCVKMY